MTAKTQLQKKKEAVPQPIGLGLLGGINDLSELLHPVADAQQGLPSEILIELIDEDPNQPRQEDNPGFSKESLEELASTIRERGIKTPISVRVNPEIDGRYIINHGARRYRASIIAGKNTIPGFIDNDYNEDDQIIENIQRDGLTPREIADRIGRKLAMGMKKIDIAKAFGKSPAFVTQHANLLDLPDTIASAFNSGRINDVTVVNELLTVHKKNPDEVSALLDDKTQEINRASVRLLREYCDEMIKAPDPATDKKKKPQAKAPDPATDKKKKPQAKDPDPEKLKKAIVRVEFGGRQARIVLTRRPPSEGFAWLKYEDDGQEFEANLQDVKIIAILEG